MHIDCLHLSWFKEKALADIIIFQSENIICIYNIRIEQGNKDYKTKMKSRRMSLVEKVGRMELRRNLSKL